MRLIKRIFSALSPWFEKGLFIKLRHAFPNPILMLRALRQPQSPESKVELNDRIIVIGLGTAALTFLQELKKEGFQNVTVVSRDKLYGGKCVNYGCMPSEFVFACSEIPVIDRSQKLQEFIGELRAEVQKQFEDLNYPIVVADADCICGARVALANGEFIQFDRLILAMGGSSPLPRQVSPSLSKLIRIEDFWTLPLGCTVVIYAEGNISALSLGDIAKSLGMMPIVLLAGTNPAGGLPSYRYFVREMTKRGVVIHERVRLIRVDADEIEFDARGEFATIAYDYLVIVSKPIPNLPIIDGIRPTIYDFDMTSASLPTRPEIAVLGDGAGFFTAAAAESQAKLLMRYWKSGERLDLRALDTMPVNLHGIQSLAMFGPEWSIAAKQWAEVDFRALGWSKVHRLEGKLWYLLDEKSGMVEACHICHKHAGELIGLGAALMAYPVSDVRWLTNATHPSSSEIFRAVADRALITLNANRSENWISESRPRTLKFHLPDISAIHPNLGLPVWLTNEKFNKAITSNRPRDYFQAYFGLAKLQLILECYTEYQLYENESENLVTTLPGGVDICINQQTHICRISKDIYIIEIS